MSKTRISRALPIVGASALAWTVACSSSVNAARDTPDGGRGAPSPTRSVTDAGTEANADAAGVCNALANVGSVVPSTANPAALPAMTGGPIADGTYVLTSAVNYAGVSAGTDRGSETIMITGNTVQRVYTVNGGPEGHMTIHQNPSGTELNATETCPGGSALAGPYTATPTSFVVQRLNAQNTVLTYTKQDPGAGYTRIDDMEGTGPRISWTPPPGTIPAWETHAATAEVGHLLSPDPSGAWSYAPVPTPYVTFPGITSTHAARVRTLGPLVNTYGADMHIIFARPAGAGVGLPANPGFGLDSVDLSAYKGITFWAMGDPNQDTTTVQVQLFEKNTFPAGGACVDGDGGTGNCFNGFSATRTLAGTFERYTIDFAELAQNPSWGHLAPGAVDLTHVYVLLFQVNTPGGASSTSSLTFDVWIDDLYFVNK